MKQIKQWRANKSIEKTKVNQTRFIRKRKKRTGIIQ